MDKWWKILTAALAYFSRSPWPTSKNGHDWPKCHNDVPRYPASKEVFFDVTPQEFEEHLRLIQKSGLTH